MHDAGHCPKRPSAQMTTTHAHKIALAWSLDWLYNEFPTYMMLADLERIEIVRPDIKSARLNGKIGSNVLD